jgi:hypothetical protein
MLLQTIGGGLAKRLINRVGAINYTTIANIMTAAAFGAWSGVKSWAGMGMVLLLGLPMWQRSDGPYAILTKHALAGGMGGAEAAAAIQSWMAVLKVLWPLLYARLYIFFTTGGRNSPGDINSLGY